ncbi:hypothetical protein [Aureibacter tunicatorum]|uniref:Adhesin n=1 Tax=Aureibacter tunicatorum TaxID=866807 RepID=A0AAE3XJC9_9BACT|nr:hypothetical protein [Aureibacter tunicatorum]MDR6237442.1 hypothetical protein [Aureibacter tunicatorum]BDD06432.1 hypothetical protein AUTU_39150 [Aureibacter tunicatorum]
MGLQNRNTLKTYFKKGQLPSEKHFNDLIDSMSNKVDDGLSKSYENGLMLSPVGASAKLISFYRSIEDKNPAWSIGTDLSNSSLHINNFQSLPVISMQQNGFVGIKNPYPKHELDVKGLIGQEGRIGTLIKSSIPANGKWHPIIENLNGCHAFEIVAGVGKKKTGKYALLHAFAISTYGKSKHKIDVRQAYYGSRRNKIDLRFKGTTYDFSLEMRTKTDYDGEYFVHFHVSRLWDDEFMNNSLNQ